jgi:hypothetical protein
MKVAICFWGLTRSLKYTIHSIRAKILKQLDDKNIEYKIFLHTYVFDSAYNNPRANEHNIKLDFDEYKLLNPDYVEIDNQDQIKKQIGLETNPKRSMGNELRKCRQLFVRHVFEKTFRTNAPSVQ